MPINNLEIGEALNMIKSKVLVFMAILMLMEKERERLARERHTKERQTRERLQKKRWEDQYYESERILDKQKERYWDKEAGIYKRPLRKTSEAKVQEEYEHKEAVIAGNIDVPGEHAAFARGHAAYQAAAEAAREDHLEGN